MESASAKQLEPDHSYSILPESLPYPSQAYGLQSPSYVSGTIDTAKETYMVPPPGSNIYSSKAPLPARSSGRWTRWPCLLLFGILIAVIAGLIGGCKLPFILPLSTHTHHNLTATNSHRESPLKQPCHQPHSPLPHPHKLHQPQ